MASLRELSVVSACLLPRSEDQQNPTLVILHIDHEERTRLIAREILMSESEVDSKTSPLLPPAIVDRDMSLLIPVAESDTSPCGVLVLGGKRCLFYQVQDDVEDRPRKKKKRRTAVSSDDEGMSDDRRESASCVWPYSEVEA